MKETKEDRFVRLAGNRVNTVLNGLRLIGNLSNKNTYSYTPEQVEKIFAAIEAGTAEAKEKFQDKARKRFSLHDYEE